MTATSSTFPASGEGKGEMWRGDGDGGGGEFSKDMLRKTDWESSLEIENI